MAIKKQEFYEGAALHMLASTERISGIIVDSPFFILNGRLLVLIKYSTKGRSPWGFTFTPHEQKRLQARAHKFSTKIGLICGADGVATLNYDEYLLIGASGGAAFHIACRRLHGEYYEVSGPNGALDRKVAPSNWQKMFDN